MKKLIALSLVLTSTQIWAQCANKVDESKVMLFVDTNDSELEINTAQKAACLRGQKLMVIPKSYKEYKIHTDKINSATNILENCLKKNNRNFDKCSSEQSKLTQTYQDRESFSKAQPKYEDEMRDVLKELKASNKKLENFTISGHDGGGHFGGNKQSFQKSQVRDLMKQFPEVNNVKSLMLLGCYTGVQREMLDWQEIFPEVRLIGGYDGSAPLASRPQGHSYLYDLLTKEKSLTADADQKKLQTLVNTTIKGLNDLNAAMLFRPECKSPEEEEKTYYYGKVGSKKELRPFDMGECLKVKTELEGLRDRLALYESAELEPPLDSAAGELRNIYNKARGAEHCTQMMGEILNANKVFNLLFYHGVKNNFAEYYDEDMKKVEEILKGEDQNKMVAQADETAKIYEDQYKEKLADIDLLEKDVDAYIKKLELKNDEETLRYNEKLKDPKFKSILDKMPQLRVLNSDHNLEGYGRLDDKERDLLNELQAASTSVLVRRMDINTINQNPKNYIEYQKNYVSSLKDSYERQKANIEYIKNNSPISKFWIPTKKNLEGKTRKQILENQHQIHQLLSLNALSFKANQALGWASMAVANRLQYHMNPFSWHEHRPGVRPETPQYEIKLDDTLNGQGIYGSFGGVVGGAAGGFSSTGGTISGANGGIQ